MGLEDVPVVIIVNGPLGIGKTATSWALLERFERAVMLDGDYIAALHPFRYDDGNHLDYAYRTLCHLVAFHVAHGYRNFIVNWVFERPEHLAALCAALATLAPPVVAVRLTCSLSELERRVRQRNNGDLGWELQRSQQLLAILEAAAADGDGGRAVDTTHLTIEQVGDEIMSIVGEA